MTAEQLARIADQPEEGTPLPEGWRWVRLNDICRDISDGTHFTPQYASSGVPFLSAKDVKVNGIAFNDCRYISHEQHEQLCRRCRPERGDVLYTKVGTTGIAKAIDIDTEFSIFVSVALLKLNEDVYPLFVEQALNSPIGKAQADNLTQGMANRNLVIRDIRTIKIPLPPTFEEQRRIAIILDQQMKAVEHARHAVEEQLTAAKLLLGALLRSAFESKEAQNWQKRKLGEFLKLRKDVIHPRDNPKGKALFVGLEHIESATGKRIGVVEMDKEKLTGRKPQFFKNDIVYGYLRPYLNKLWIAEFDGLCSVDQYVYSVDSGEADRDYLAYFMRSPVYLATAPIESTPGQLPRIRIEEVASVELKLPPIERQRVIAEKLTDQMKEVEQLTNCLVEQMKTIEKMPSALLREAFAKGV